MQNTLNIQIQQTENSGLSKVDFDNIPFGKTFSDHMFTADYVDGEWKNFRIAPYQSITVSPANSALHYGQSIFEGLKAVKNKEGELLLFRPEENAKRLNASAQRMCMPEIPEEVFMEGLKKLLDVDRAWIPADEGKSLYIRPFMFAADDFLGVKSSDTYRFIIITGPVSSYYSEPVRVKIETQYTRAAEGGVGYAKTAGNYAASLYPARVAQKEGYHQLLWTDGKEHKYIEESGTMNVMFMIGDTLITAKPSDTILHGITRKSVLQLAREWGVKVEERQLSVTELLEAAENGTLKEAFGTGTAATIAQIATIGYKGKDYDLPPVEERELSNKLLATLDAIKTGKQEDTHNWITKA